MEPLACRSSPPELPVHNGCRKHRSAETRQISVVYITHTHTHKTALACSPVLDYMPRMAANTRTGISPSTF